MSEELKVKSQIHIALMENNTIQVSHDEIEKAGVATELLFGALVLFWQYSEFKEIDGFVDHCEKAKELFQSNFVEYLENYLTKRNHKVELVNKFFNQLQEVK